MTQPPNWQMPPPNWQVPPPNWQVPAPVPPPPPVNPNRNRNRLFVGTAIGCLLVGGAIGAAGGTTTTETVASPAVSVTETATATATTTQTVTMQPTKVVATRTVQVRITYTPPPVNPLSDGTWVVGQQVIPGVYSTNGQGDGSNTMGCYYARLSSFTSSDIIDNGNFKGPTTIQVLPSDKALELSGGCTWSKTG